MIMHCPLEPISGGAPERQRHRQVLQTVLQQPSALRLQAAAHPLLWPLQHTPGKQKMIKNIFNLRKKHVLGAISMIFDEISKKNFF